MLMLARRFALVFGLFLGALASQIPEYAQQYRQRLGGAIDELTTIVRAFDDQAASLGLARDAAVTRLEANADELARQRGSAMRETIARRDRLVEQDEAFARAGSFGRVAVLAQDFDPGIARGAWERFEPAVPVTTEGITLGALGFLAGYAVWRMLMVPFTRRRPREVRRA